MRDRYYVDGNTVRKLNTAPERIRREKRERVVDPRIKKEKRIRKARARQAMEFDLQYTVILVFALIATLIAFMGMLTLQAKISEKNEHIASLKTTLTVLSSENDAYASRLEGSLDLIKIYKVATEEMGMVYPENGQIVQYDAKNPDYVKQYKEIPVLDN